MEFWGVEVPVNTPLKCIPGDDKYIHLSQVCLGEFKKGSSGTVPVTVTVDDNKFVIGTLIPGSCNQISLDLVFEKEVQFSHGWKDGSVFLTGYKTINAVDDDMDDFCSSDSEDEEDVVAVPLENKSANGKVDKDEQSRPTPKPLTDPSKPKVKANGEDSKTKAKGKLPVVSKKDEKDEDDSDESDEDFGEDDDSDSEMIERGDDSSDDSDEDDNDDEDDDDSSSDEEEVKVAPPPKAEAGKKRPASSDAKASLPGKKAKTVIPAAKSDVQKGGDKKTTPTKQQQQTPKSAGSVNCKSCSKTFKSEASMQAHSKAKHA
ncbi:hypothetical protein ZOSMA_1G03850 [Zostera marina]|uniref:C2H2-type domain-containing protein n=1 Tax=Zostera marina TaxID=29655 RepID=A0A0K9PQ91_ZOSMR|nr:hypothetical protein ZOSMA_1G03850 [Zostera marina]